MAEAAKEVEEPRAAVAPAAATAAAAEQGGQDGNDAAKSILVLFNVGKRQNFGTLIRSACAFGVSEILAVGAQKLALFGNQGTASNAPIRQVDTLDLAKAELKQRGIRLCGVEITDDAVPVNSLPFTGPTAFMLGNEGIGMTEAQKAACDFFVYIPQYTGATASLNVAIAGSIVLHHFALWAGMAEHQRAGEKFVVEQRTALDRYQKPTDFQKAEIERKRAERAKKRQLEDDAPDDAAAAEDVGEEEGE
eukprot:TRINITY_DN46729_c0_g1_i1.p2 TRINITY_DN46729_c0_g1~~TRINITY_DN46729_c0_g1_i1.p2  ORF type:complete len:249 (-),score=72.17 TRINITY_DN46729_c0_g1_i1:216-962(-)